MAAQMEESDMSYLECQVCFEEFDEKLRIPRLLLCGHTFCQVCIDSLEIQMIVKCPNKDGDTKLGAKRALGLNKNYALLKVIDVMQELPFSGKIGALICGNDCVENATKCCEECGCNLCDTCCLDIHKIRMFRNHRISGNLKRHNVVENMCESHKKELELYCSQDQVCICTLCAFTTHKNHDISSISEVAEQKKGTLQKLSLKLRSEEQRLFGISRQLSKESKKIQSDYVSASEQIADVFKILEDKMNAAKSDALKKIYDVTNMKDAVMQKTREDVSLRISEISVTIEAVKQKTISQDDVAFLRAYDDILKQMDLIDTHQKFSVPPKDTSKPVLLNRDSFDSISRELLSLVHVDIPVPEVPIIIRAKVWRNSATVSWQKAGKNDILVGTELRYAEEEKELHWKNISLDKARSSTVLCDLKYGKTYAVELRNKNSNGWSSYSKQLRFQTELKLFVQCKRCQTRFCPYSNEVCTESKTEYYHPGNFGFPPPRFYDCCHRGQYDKGCKTKTTVTKHEKHLQ